MGRRKDHARTPGLWIATSELPHTGGHPVYQRLNRMLDEHAFDEFVEAQCAPFYAAKLDRPSLTPSGCNLGLLMRTLCRAGTPRSLQGGVTAAIAAVAALWTLVIDVWTSSSPRPSAPARSFAPSHRYEL